MITGSDARRAPDLWIKRALLLREAPLWCTSRERGAV